ncbi:VacJ family lipoprotein [Candidatus Magnetaquicoccus inordinatus]|uniref:MlaA family lipoprotein n=1 Tax=Candidatus Magnetaquicoccus inordinatus TaxID=2496818 RepID=UPI00187D500C|nr:VacJ family lipoprotein [Candidatus Magnetaquicoccus inordinatus]
MLVGHTQSTATAGENRTVPESTSESDGQLAFSIDDVSDPLEPVNRFFFEFNDLFYMGILRPVATVYGELVPEGVRVGVRNVFQNLATPTRVVSTILEGEISQSGVELARFGVNTIFGFFGFFDVAGEAGLKSTQQDLGQALGRWGAGDSLYLVLPIVGPSNLRDGVGWVGDTLMNPLTYVPGDIGYRAGLVAHRTVNDTSLHLGEYEDLKKSAVDPYISLRDAYLQRRRALISE